MTEEKQDIALGEFVPQPTLVVEEHIIEKARFPAVDAHNHLGWWEAEKAGELVALMDEVGLQAIVSLDGGRRESLDEHLNAYPRKYPGRFVVFTRVPWNESEDPEFPKRAGEQLKRDVEAGARGLKVSKVLGLRAKNPEGELYRADDDRLAPIWEACAELGIPVLIHIADPVAFFQPLDGRNERWEELQNHQGWHFFKPGFPSFEELMEQQEHLVAAHPKTTFISAHVGSYAENLTWISGMFDRYPNYYVDISARIAELGRQPYTARKWFIKYADRILFGTDGRPSVDNYRVHWRFLETADEYFNYSTGDPPGQGRWRIFGVFLPDEVLRKVYYENAARLVNLE
ncbi:MAG: amidohydrolase family protein [Planctomycetes bacterium]|nr:amidohydrolase family protein [Planctomycetota bacterium]